MGIIFISFLLLLFGTGLLILGLKQHRMQYRQIGIAVLGVAALLMLSSILASSGTSRANPRVTPTPVPTATPLFIKNLPD